MGTRPRLSFLPRWVWKRHRGRTGSTAGRHLAKPTITGMAFTGVYFLAGGSGFCSEREPVSYSTSCGTQRRLWWVCCPSRPVILYRTSTLFYTTTLLYTSTLKIQPKKYPLHGINKVVIYLSLDQGCPTSRSRSTSRSPIDPKSIARGEEKKIKKLRGTYTCGSACAVNSS